MRLIYFLAGRAFALLARCIPVDINDIEFEEDDIL